MPCSLIKQHENIRDSPENVINVQRKYSKLLIIRSRHISTPQKLNLANYLSLLCKSHALKNVRIQVLMRVTIMLHISNFVKQHLNEELAIAIF